MIAGAALALLASLALPQASDPVLRDLERAFVLLEDDPKQHARARALLERATARFEDTALDGSDVQKALVSDATKPYRGRPWERVLAHVVLAALDIERGRCDLALPSLKSAAFFAHKPGATSDPAARTDGDLLVRALTRRCLIEVGASDADVDAAGDIDEAVLRAVLDPRAVLVLDGRGPALTRGGGHGDVVVVVDRSAERTRPIVIALGERSAKRAKLPKGGAVLWSSTTQARAVAERPFTAVLASRARFKDQAQRDGSASLDRGVRGLTQGAGSASGASNNAAHVGAAVSAVAGAGWLSLGAATDARADDRFVSSLPERVRVVVMPARRR